MKSVADWGGWHRVPERPRWRSRAWGACVAMVWALLLGSHAGAAPLTLAIGDLPLFTPVLIADAQGYFADEGLSLKVLHCVNGKRCLQHLLDGEAQIATVADTPIVMASFTRRDFAIVASFANSTTESKLIARADRRIRTAAELRGKRIGVVRGTSGHYFTNGVLLYHGIDSSQVTLVALDPADPVGPLVRGEVDAIGSYEPAGYLARERLGDQALVLATPPIFNVLCNLVVSRAGAGVAEADIVKLLRAVQRAERMIAAEPARARALLAERLHADPKHIDAIWSAYHFELSLDQSLLGSLESQARWARREGLVSGREPDYLDLVDPAPLRQVDRRAVTLVK